jgi:hypothetical protein
VALALWAAAVNIEAQQPFVHSNDLAFTIRIDHKRYKVGEQIVIHYTITNVSNGALFVPKSQWDIRCGDPPHLRAWLEDSSGKHYEPGYGGSCLHPSPVDRMSISERMRKDALFLRAGQSVTGSFSFDSHIFAKVLKPGFYRLETALYGWNSHFDDAQLSQLAAMGAPLLIGETHATIQVELQGASET